MLEQQGVGLADVDVSAQSEQQQSDAEVQQSDSGMMQQGEVADTGVQDAGEVPVTRINLAVESGINLYA